MFAPPPSRPIISHQDAVKVLASAVGRRRKTPNQDRPRVQEAPIQRISQPPGHQRRQPEYKGETHACEHTVLCFVYASSVLHASVVMMVVGHATCVRREGKKGRTRAVEYTSQRKTHESNNDERKETPG